MDGRWRHASIAPSGDRFRCRSVPRSARFEIARRSRPRCRRGVAQLQQEGVDLPAGLGRPSPAGRQRWPPRSASMRPTCSPAARRNASCAGARPPVERHAGDDDRRRHQRRAGTPAGRPVRVLRERGATGAAPGRCAAGQRQARLHRAGATIPPARHCRSFRRACGSPSPTTWSASRSRSPACCRHGWRASAWPRARCSWS